MAFPLFLTLLVSAVSFFSAVFLIVRLPRSFTLALVVALMMLIGATNSVVTQIGGASSQEDADLLLGISMSLILSSVVVFGYLILIFPFDYAVLASRLRKRLYSLSFSILIIAAVLLSFFTASAEVTADDSFWFGYPSGLLSFGFISGLATLMVIFFFIINRSSSESTKKTALTLSIAMDTFIIFLIIFVISGQDPEDWIWVDFGLLSLVLILTYRFATHRTDLLIPMPELSSTGSKSSYKLLEGRNYVVEEERPKFSFDLFSEILRRRCYDCNNDESFVCESLDCTACSLPCPCKECSQHVSRTQGLVITRKHPNETRAEYFIQTTPIVWLTSIPGKDNMDPAKLSLLTDMIVNFVEKSHNGVVLVEGIEYLITANDFQRVLRAIDRWSEVVMSNASRLIISLNPNAFTERELAFIERNREVVKPEVYRTMEKIFAHST
ncbi:MAG TPA: DUF835 domain-containing protein [Euryarchaeota archaeon]|nr:DUF835 domain-containing protein [Euryarchaeota archaeon]